MDTMKDTKMQPATDAVIDKLRKMQPIAWYYEDMLGRKCVGFERPLHRRNTHEPLFSAATHAVIDELRNRLEAAEKERDKLKELNSALCTKSNSQVIHNARLAEENDALRAEIAEMEQQEPARLVTAVAYRWRYRGAVMWQYGELTEETARRAKEHNHEVQSLGVLPGAKGE